MAHKGYFLTGGGVIDTYGLGKPLALSLSDGVKTAAEAFIPGLRDGPSHLSVSDF